MTDFAMPINPDAFAVVFGFTNADAREELMGIVEQLKAEAFDYA